MTVVYLICGYSGAGKDTVGAHIAKRHGSTHYAFADGVREVAIILGDRYNVHNSNDDDNYFPYTEAFMECGGYEAVKRDPLFKDGVRDYLVKIGHGLRQVLGDDVWVNRVIIKIMETTPVAASVVITDCRYVNELQRMRDELDTVVAIWVERDGVGPANETEAKFTTPLRDLCDLVIINKPAPSVDEIDWSQLDRHIYC